MKRLISSTTLMAVAVGCMTVMVFFTIFGIDSTLLQWSSLVLMFAGVVARFTWDRQRPTRAEEHNAMAFMAIPLLMIAAQLALGWAPISRTLGFILAGVAVLAAGAIAVRYGTTR
ncbi:MAG: hypothetical protein K2X99_04990 [Gemmatimonadaceae bacterium]|nr:hypothetical protein [Gemmatimonadaceae bacterium]